MVTAVMNWAALLAVFSSAVPVLALDPNRQIDQYVHEFWTSQNGLVGEAVYQILQGPDGYLWLRTSAGLVRFDGVRFVLVSPAVGSRPIDEPVKALCKSTDGDLLLRTTSHTLIYRNGTFSDYRPPMSLPDGDIRVLFESARHELLIGSDDFIYRIENDGTPTELKRRTAWTYSFLEDRGVIWIGGNHGLYRYQNGRLSLVQDVHGARATALLRDHHGSSWLATGTGVLSRHAHFSSLDPVSSNALRSEINALVEDGQDNIWVGTSYNGLARITGHQVSTFSSLDGLTDSKVLSLYEDREGSLWVGTASGLDRLRNSKLTTLTTHEGLPADLVYNVIQARDGTVYVLCQGGGMAPNQGRTG